MRAQGEGDPDCQWRVRVHRLDGCVTLENVKFSWPLAIRDDGEIEMNTLSPQAVSTPILGARLYPQVIRCVHTVLNVYCTFHVYVHRN